MDNESKQVPDFKWHHVNTIDEMQEFYLSRLPAIREAAREHGYAIGLHGSTRRDFDLIAVPWVETASDKETLVRAIHWAACGLYSASYHWEIKPRGRVATSFPICWDEFHGWHRASHIDLSIVDPAAAYERGQRDMRERAAELVARNVINFNTGTLMPVDPALAKHPDVTRGAYSAAIRALPILPMPEEPKR